jgi:hypothetical protein
MSRFLRLLSALTLALLLSPPAAADDEQEVQKYVLTDAGLAKYSQAARQLAMMDAAQTGACDESEDSEDSQSISDVVAKFDRYPAAKNVITSAGMTPREYVVFSFALLQTGLAVWGADQSGGQAQGVSAANVAFYKRNEANLKKLETVTQPRYCEEEEDDGESGE